MAIVQPNMKNFGSLSVTIYDFKTKGDILPIHTHTPTDNHITVVAKGTFKVIGDEEIANTIIKQGNVIDWKSGIEHGFISLVDDSRLVNIVKR